MEKERQYIELDEANVLRLPYFGSTSRRIYVITGQGEKIETRELFVQRFETFTTNLVYLINSLKNHEISEIRYGFGIDCLIRILLNDEGKLLGECSWDQNSSSKT